MNVFTYLERIYLGLPTHDSGQLIAAKKCNPTLDNSPLASPYDLSEREMDPFMFGVITPTSDANDILSSRQLEECANEIYKSINQ
jgi:hypothetical protein